MSKLLVLANEATASQRRVYFHLVDATDGITPETGEAAGQPQVSSDGGAWTNTGIGTLTAIGNGRYYADLTQTLVATPGTQIETRYKSANTAECPGDSVQVVAFDPNDAVRMGLTALPNAAADAAGGLPISDAGGLDLDAQIGTKINDIRGYLDTEIAAILAAVDTEVASILADTDELQQDWANGGRLDLLIDSILADTNELQTDWVNGGRLDLLLDTVVAATAAAAIRSAVGLASANLDTQLTAIDDYIDTEVAAILSAVDTEISAIISTLGSAGAGLSAIPWNASWDAEVQSEVDDALKAALTEGYRGTGATGSVRDLLYEIIAHLGESSISSTTKTLKKIDGSTTAKTYTLDSATTPTSITETT